MKENIDKRIYCAEEIDFLGYNIKLNKIVPKLDRVEGIINLKTPKSKKEVQKFLGLINYDRRFVKNMSDLIKTLTQLIGKDIKFKWNEVHEQAFENIKSLWRKELRIEIPDWNETFILESDASNTGLGAVLKQKDKPVAFISRLLTSAEQGYSITEKEVLASLWAMEKLEYYLAGKEFILITDNQAMISLKSKKEFGSCRIKRWFERLIKFNLKVQYRKGIEMVQADALSKSLNTLEKGEEEMVARKVFKIKKS